MTLQYDPREVTDWLTPLERVYARQTRQLQEHHANLRERDRQEEAATFTADQFNKMIKDFTTLSKTAKDIQKKYEANKQTEFETDWNKLELDTQELIEQIAFENDLSLKGTNLINKLKENKTLVQNDPHAIDFIEKQSGHKALRLRRLLGWEAVKSSVNYLDDAIEKDPILRDDYEAHDRVGKLDAFYTKRTHQRLEKLGLNQKYIATHFSPEIKRLSQTKGLAKVLDYKAHEFAKKNVERVTEFENFKWNPRPDIVSNRLSTLLKDSIADDPLKGRSNAVIFLHRLNKEGKINSTVIEAMKTGALSEEAQKNGFKTGVDLLSAEDWKYIEQGEQEYLTRIKTDHDVAYAARGAQIEVGLINKTINPDQLKQFLLEAKNNGQETTDWYKKLSNYNPSAQNLTVFQEGDKEFGRSKNKGTLHNRLEEIKNHPNDEIRQKYQPLAEEVETFIKDHPDSFGNLDKVLKDFAYSTRTGNSLENNIPSADDNFVVEKLKTFTYQRLYHYLEQQLKGAEPIDNLSRVIQDERNAYWEANGGNLVAENGQTAPGMFSRVRKNGNLEWANIGVVSRETNNRAYDHTYSSPYKDKSYTNKVAQFGNISKEERWERVGGIYTKDQLLGLKKYLYFSEDMKYDAARDGLLPGEAYNKAIEALVNSTDQDDKDFATRHNLKGWTFNGKEEAPDVSINNALTNRLKQIEATPTADLNEANVIKNLQSHIRWYGFDSLSMKNRELIYNIIAKFDTSSQVSRDAIVDSVKQEQAEKESAAQLARDTELKRAEAYQEQRKKAKEEQDKQAAQAAEILQKNIEGLWTP